VDVLLAFVAMPRPHLAKPEPHAPAIEDVLGPLGAAVMRVVWAQGSASVSLVVDALNAERARPLAYTTVMTVMARLSERGLLERERKGRQYIYRPASDEHSLLASLSGRAIDQLLARYGTTALAQFAQRLADAEPELRDRLLKLASRREP